MTSANKTGEAGEKGRADGGGGTSNRKRKEDSEKSREEEEEQKSRNQNSLFYSFLFCSILPTVHLDVLPTPA